MGILSSTMIRIPIKQPGLDMERKGHRVFFFPCLKSPEFVLQLHLLSATLFQHSHLAVGGRFCWSSTGNLCVLVGDGTKTYEKT